MYTYIYGKKGAYRSASGPPKLCGLGGCTPRNGRTISAYKTGDLLGLFVYLTGAVKGAREFMKCPECKARMREVGATYYSKTRKTISMRYQCPKCEVICIGER